MTALTSQKIKDSFEQILHVDTDGGGQGSTPVPVKDGDNGTTFALELADDKIRVKDPTSGNRIELGHGANSEGYIKLTADNGTDVYLTFHWNGEFYEIKLSTSAP